MYVYDDSIWWLEREARKPGTSTHLVMLLQLIKDEPKRTAEAVAKSARETPVLKVGDPEVARDVDNRWLALLGFPGETQSQSQMSRQGLLKLRYGPALKVLQDIVNAWDENEIGQVDGELIETARKALEEMGMK